MTAHAVRGAEMAAKLRSLRESEGLQKASQVDELCDKATELLKRLVR
jgi:hypothetical protein